MHRRYVGWQMLIAALMLCASLAAMAQPAAKVYRIGYLSTPSRESVQNGLNAFLQALRKHGWVDGQNIIIEYRWAEGKVERLPELAEQLVRLPVDLIVAPAGSAALAAKRATSSIPIVMIFPSDPVEMGLVKSLREPGGNVTGTSFTPGPEIFGKQLQLLTEAVPRASRVAILRNPADPTFALQEREWESAARTLNVQLQYVDARGAEDLDSAFAAMKRERADALLVGGSSMFLVHQAKIAALARNARLPTMYSYRESVDAGGLMSYSVNMADFVGNAAGYVDRILKGEKPAGMAVQQPKEFELVINQQTARALGLTLPRTLLERTNTRQP